MTEGEITAEEFNAALLELGTEPVAQEAATSVSTMEGAVGNLQAAIVGGLSDAFTTIKPVLTDIVNGLAGFVTFIQDNISWIGPLAGGIAIVAGAVAAWTIAQWALNAALTANPIGLIIVGIGLLIGAIILLVQNWDTVVAWISDVWGGFINWITGVINGFVGWWNGIWAAVGQWITNVWNGIVTGVTGFFLRLYSGLVSIGSGLLGWWNGLWTGVGNFFKGIWDGILGTIRNVQTAFSLVFNAIAGIVRGAFEGVVGVVRGVINGIIGAVNGVIGSINGVAGAIGGAIGVNIRIPSIPRLASGGIIQGSSSGTLALVGEAGRGRDEAVLPLPPGWRENGLGGLSDGQELTLVVDGQPMRAYVSAVAGAVASQQSQDRTMRLLNGYRG
jgi:phage-related protein